MFMKAIIIPVGVPSGAVKFWEIAWKALCARLWPSTMRKVFISITSFDNYNMSMMTEKFRTKRILDTVSIIEN